jgi:hypothetical protein
MADETVTRAKAVELLATIVRWAGLAAAIILVTHIILVAGEANPANWITRVIRGLADPISFVFKDLFNKPSDAKLRILINYGIAALFWMIISSVLSRLIRRLA